MIPALAVGLVAGSVALGLAGWGSGVLALLVASWGTVALDRYRLTLGGVAGLLGVALVAGLDLGSALLGCLVGLATWGAVLYSAGSLDWD